MRLLFTFLFFLPTLVISLELSEPVLNAEKALKIANSYLVSEQKITLKRYTIESVSFDFLDNRWSIFYDGKANEDGTVGLGDHFIIILSNSEKPTIELVHGL